MQSTYEYPKYAFQAPRELQGKPSQRYPVVVVGAGPVGLVAAIDLAQQGVPVVLLDDDDTVSVGSRGVCYAKRVLEILDRLGVGNDCVDKGVSWSVGRTFFRTEEVYCFNLLSQPDHRRPGMINLQQYYLEEFLVRRARKLPLLDLRFRSKVIGLQTQEQGVTLQVETPEGEYSLAADWLIAADGAHSSIRRAMGLEVEGKVFMDRFLIADVVMKADFPAERWFWFDPPFHPGQSVLLHHQADNVWRIDFQLGWDADPEEQKRPENVIPRIKAMLGEEHEFELEWVSVYTFQCRRMAQFRHGRVLFAGDAAHQVSPFGARGANSGIQDADNLIWKLRLVLEDKAPETLLDTYSEERTFAATENLRNSTRSTDFITPKTRVSLAFRNAVLDLARQYPFARALVNSGRFSVPSIQAESSLNTPDTAEFAGDMVPGAPCDDSPMRAQVDHFWLLDRLGNRFQLLVYVDQPSDVHQAAALQGLMGGDIPIDVILVSPSGGRSPHGLRVFEDYSGRFAERYDARDGSAWLIRPDQHIAGRWRSPDAARIRAAAARATCRQE
ncbi:FAD-dependent oxidoreductase [Castellaniella sp. MT123]|uniref:FAD-dependent oxidoreductase n=1 Tax=Castellaniella sp. MT123 TaxID=3140381 RepID=UPI0031F39E1E